MTAEGEGWPVLCHRCGSVLTPGRGDFYVVRIEAVADPTPPDLSDAPPGEDLARQMHELIRQMEGMTERDMLDQVHRRLTVHLCRSCFTRWIDNPTG